MLYNYFVVEVWLSLVEYYVRDVGAAGSNPVTSTILNGLDSLNGESELFLSCGDYRQFYRVIAVVSFSSEISVIYNKTIDKRFKI